MKTKMLLMQIIFLSLFITTLVTAQNFNDALRLSQPGIISSARALGMGNAYSAVSDDYTGSIFNPAGLGLIKRMEVAGGFQYTNFGNKVTFFDKVSDFDQSSTAFSQIGIVFPFPTLKGSFVLAFGYNRVNDFNRTTEFDGFNPNNNSMIQFLTGDVNDEIPITNALGLGYEIRDPQTENYIKDTTVINGRLNQSGSKLEEGSIDSWALSGAVEVAQDFFVGGTFNIYSGSYIGDKEFYEDDVFNNYNGTIRTDPNDPRTSDFQTFYLKDVIDWDIAGWDFKLGFLYKYRDKFRFGANIKFPSQFTIKENFSIDGSSEFGNGQMIHLEPEFYDDEYDISTPYEFSAGGAFSISSLIVSADVKYIDYTQMEFTEGLDDLYRSQENRRIKSAFEGGLNYNVGAEFQIPHVNVRLRGGFIYQSSPFRDDPTKFDKKYLTGGIGILAGNSVSFDIGYAHGWWEDFGDNYDSNVSRTFQDITTDNLIFTVSYRY